VSKNNRTRNWLILLAAGAGLAVLLFSRGGGLIPSASDSKPVPLQRSADLAPIAVRLHPIAAGGLQTELELTGNLLPQRRTLIVSEVDGVVQSIRNSSERIEAELEGRVYSQQLSVNLGHRVEQGELLVELDPREYELQLAAAEARQDQAQRQLEDLLAWRRPEVVQRLQARKDEALARLEKAQADQQRIKSLVEQRATSPFELDQAVAELHFAQAAVASAEADLAEARSGPTPTEVEVARTLVAQAAAEVAVHRDRLARTKIRAPYSGVITERFVDEGERVTTMPRVELMELIDVQILMVQVSIPERFVGRISTGDWVSVSLVGSEQAVPGLVVLVNEKVDYETRTFRVRVGIENFDYRFKAGQFARVRFRLEEARQALIVPAAAVLFAGGQPQVFVYHPETQQVQLRSIQLGLSNAEACQVLEGLAEGEQVVIDDPAILADGMRVSVDDSLSPPAAFSPDRPDNPPTTLSQPATPLPQTSATSSRVILSANHPDPAVDSPPAVHAPQEAR
jgi:HlyD family secretion protein